MGMPMMQLSIGRHARLQVAKAPGAARRRESLRGNKLLQVEGRGSDGSKTAFFAATKREQQQGNPPAQSA
jgi:hypothetical protein